MVNASSTDDEISYGQLIGKGILFGILHVLSGPDHLAALVALSANVGKCRAFSLGIGWGVGHSTGLVVVATILLLSLTDTTTGTVRIKFLRLSIDHGNKDTSRKNNLMSLLFPCFPFFKNFSWIYLRAQQG
jgi:hypothetical protein